MRGAESECVVLPPAISAPCVVAVLLDGGPHVVRPAQPALVVHLTIPAGKVLPVTLLAGLVHVGAGSSIRRPRSPPLRSDLRVGVCGLRTDIL